MEINLFDINNDRDANYRPQTENWKTNAYTTK